jgi:hypothetical protein
MVRHNKRHSRKKGGRSRRQHGGMWSSLITADKNVDSMTEGKGIDIKYKGSPPKRQWLIGGTDKTILELFDDKDEKGKRYADVMKYILSMRGMLRYNEKGMTLSDEEFCHVFIKGPLANRYPTISLTLERKGIDVCSGVHVHPMMTHMHKAQRGPSAASRASAPHEHNKSRADAAGLGDSTFSGNIARGRQ